MRYIEHFGFLLLFGIFLLLPIFIFSNWIIQRIFPTLESDPEDRQFVYGLIVKVFQASILAVIGGSVYLIITHFNL